MSSFDKADGGAHPLVIQATVAMIAAIMLTIWGGMFLLLNMHEPRNMTQIECLVHRTDPVVHKFCHDHGYETRE